MLGHYVSQDKPSQAKTFDCLCHRQNFSPSIKSHAT